MLDTIKQWWRGAKKETPTQANAHANEKTQYKRIRDSLVAQDIFMSLKYMGMWVKNSKFEFMEISDQVARILYQRSSSDCVGLTDYNISRECGVCGECGMFTDEEQFAKVCRASDLYLKGEKQCRFIEIIADTEGNMHIWRTTKSRVIFKNELYYFGFAEFLDVIYGDFDTAHKEFQKLLPLLNKINEQLYVYK